MSKDMSRNSRLHQSSLWGDQSHACRADVSRRSINVGGSLGEGGSSARGFSFLKLSIVEQYLFFVELDLFSQVCDQLGIILYFDAPDSILGGIYDIFVIAESQDLIWELTVLMLR